VLFRHANTYIQQTHPFYGLWTLSGITRVSRYQKGKTNLDFTEARDSEWQWHQLGHLQICTLPEIDNHTNTPPLSIFTGQMLFLSQPPHISWVGTGTKYAGLHTQWLGFAMPTQY